jgi:hypothetical protein
MPRINLRKGIDADQKIKGIETLFKILSVSIV